MNVVKVPAMKLLSVLLVAAALTLTGCSAPKPAPTLEDAGKACVRYVIDKESVTPKQANRICEILYEKNGKKAFIEAWT